MNKMNTCTNILMVGVGGQGVILASEIVSEAAMRAGFDVKKSEVHGMAQRGGSVNSHVRFGTTVHSPIIKKGEVDILFSLELLETLRYLDHLADDPLVIVNNHKIMPPSVNIGKDSYPDNIAGILSEKFSRFHLVDAPALAREAGNPRTVNVVFTGFLSKFLNIDADFFNQAISEMLPAKIIDVNHKAFSMGRNFNT